MANAGTSSELASLSGLGCHYELVRGIEAQGSCRQAICDKIDPQQLHRVQHLGHTYKDIDCP